MKNTAQLLLEAAPYFIGHDGSDESIPAILFEGEPGAGKTFAAKKFCESNNYELVPLQCVDNTGPDELMFGVDVVKLADAISVRGVQTGADVIYNGTIIKAFELSWKRKVLCLIDEFDKSRNIADAFFLTVLNDGCMYHPSFDGGRVVCNRRNIIFVFTSNKNRDFIDPLARRWVKHTMKFPTITEMRIIIPAILGEKLTEKIGKEIIELFINFLYKWRAGNPKKTLVQNELGRILMMLNHAKDIGDKEMAEILLPIMVSSEEEDLQRWDNANSVKPLASGMGPKYLVAKFFSDAGK